MAEDDQKPKNDAPGPSQIVPTIIAKIGYPEFDAKDIDTWFMCQEAEISVNQVKVDKQKFNAVIVALGPRAKLVYSTIAKCNDTDNNERYDTLKAAVIAYFQPSEAQRLSSLLSGITLGDQNPSVFLSEMRRLGGTGCTDSVLTNLWLRALPTTLRSIIAALPTATLDEQAKVADKIMEAPRNEISAIPERPEAHRLGATHRSFVTTPGTSPFWTLPSPSAGPKSLAQPIIWTPLQPKNRRWICWFHYRHNVQARKCEKQHGDNQNAPCIFYDGKIPVYVRQEKN
ncbi:uncharacterized protein LOC131680657 [Topomyia yanbarensis]|uniref:uncharacterized protein LOC131680657 n=1 Tax=Topomyia yanbarensis TaxID=2498891 RepID=UPI00273AAEE5|nr:uncharacterized protein LOC131680657 [Topomyia yanbarensis]